MKDKMNINLKSETREFYGHRQNNTSKVRKEWQTFNFLKTDIMSFYSCIFIFINTHSTCDQPSLTLKSPVAD